MARFLGPVLGGRWRLLRVGALLVLVVTASLTIHTGRAVATVTSVTLTATASGPVTVGGTIQDIAHLSGGVNPAGTISFEVFAPGDTTCSTPLTPPPASATVSGNGDYFSGDFTPTAAGDYRWIASYTGDSNNSPATTACNDPNQSSTANPATPGLSANAFGGTVGGTIQDVAHLAGGFNETGTISFEVFAPGDTSCSTPLSPAPTGASVFLDGDYFSGDFTPTAAGDYRWIASYSGDSNNSPATTACNDPNQTSVVTQPLVEVTKVADPVGPVSAGTTIGFDITVTNIGTATETGVSLNDPLPSTPAGVGTWSISSGPSGTASPLPTCSVNTGVTPNVLTCSAVDLAAGASYTLHASAQTGPTTNGSVTNTATITSTNGNCTSGSTDTRCRSTASVNVTGPPGRVAPSGTTCQQFITGTAPALGSIFYTLSGGKISQNVNPGAFFYYTQFTATAGQTFTVTQTNNNSLGDLFFRPRNGHAVLHTSSCSTATGYTVSINAAAGRVTYHVTTAATYIVGIQYSSKSIAGDLAPSPSTVTFSFEAGTVPATLGTAKLVNSK